MATCTRGVWKVVSGCQKQLLRGGASSIAAVSQTTHRRLPVTCLPVRLPVRSFAAVKSKKKDKKEAEKDTEKELERQRLFAEERARRRALMKPVDDVYLIRFYPKKVHQVTDAIELLKAFRLLDLSPPDQQVYIDLKLDLKLEKKRKVDPFVSTVQLPHRFNTNNNTVLVFTEDPQQAKEAVDNGAAIVGGTELIQQILDEEVSADFYLAVPKMMPKLLQLKNKLRKKFPKSSRGTVGVNIPQMLEIFKTGFEYMVETDGYVKTQIATLDMPTEQIFANLQTIVLDVCSHKPVEMGPMIERAIIASHCSEALLFNFEDIVPKPVEDDEP